MSDGGASGWQIACAVGLVAAFAAGARLHRRRQDLPPLERWLAALLPGLAAGAAVSLAGAVIHGTYFYWNFPRLAMVASWARGYPMYSPPGAGPVLNSTYPPVSQLALLPAAWPGSTLAASLVQTLLAGAFFLGPPLWAIARLGRRAGRLQVALAAGVFVMLTLTSYALRTSAFFQPVDAVALGLAGGAVATLALHARGDGGVGLLTASALLAVLAVWSKQTMAPLGLALPLYLLAARGWRALLSYLWRLAAASVLVGGALLAAFAPVRDLVFNIFVLHSHHPVRADAVPFMYPLALLRECRESALGLALVVPAAVAAARLPLPPAPAPAEPAWRARVRSHPFMAFAWTALWMLPTSYLAFMKEGGRINSCSAVTYFLAVAAVLCLLGEASLPGLAAIRGRPLPAALASRLAPAAFPAAGLLVAALALTPGWRPEPLHAVLQMLLLAAVALAVHAALSGRAEVRAGAALLSAVLWLQMLLQILPFSVAQLDRAGGVGPRLEAGITFARSHPGEVFFPYDPLTTLLEERRLYHFDYGLHDRALAGFAVTPAHFRAHLPPRLRFVLYPRWVDRKDTPRDALALLPEFVARVPIRGLEDWDVYVRMEDALRWLAPVARAP